MTPTQTYPAVHGAALRVASTLRPANPVTAPPVTARTTDTTAITAMHRSVRLTARALADRTQRIGHYDLADADELRRYWHGFRSAVHTFQEIEETVIHPALLARVPAAAGAIGLATRDHRLLDDLMAEADTHLVKVGWGIPAAAAARVMQRIDDLIHRHLDLEDTDVLALLARHASPEEHAELAATVAGRLAEGKQAQFTVPFIGSWLAPSDRAHLLAGAPSSFRMRDRLSRRRHARLTTRALRDSRARSFDAHIDPA